MEPAFPPFAARIRRFLDRDRNLLVATGDFGGLHDAWFRHVVLWEGEPDSLARTLLRDGLALAALHLSSRPRNETIAWTLNLREPARNLFLTGSSADGNVTGRVVSEGVRVEESSRLFVQISRPGHEPHTSVTDVRGLDLLGIFEQFYAQSEQLPARFFRLSGQDYLSVHALPGADRKLVASLDAAATLALVSESSLIQARLFRFECGCTPDKMIRTVRALFQEKPEELFHGDDRVEVSCPRCGRRWWVHREGF